MSSGVSASYGLPEYARIDEGVLQTVLFEVAGSAVDIAHNVPGEFFEQPLAVFVNLSTDATASNRLVIVSFIDSTGLRIAQVPSAQTTPANSNIGLTFLPNVSTFTALLNTYYIAPLPLLFLAPGCQVEIAVSSAGAGDRLFGASMQMLRIPTGGELQPPVAAIPTPLLT